MKHLILTFLLFLAIGLLWLGAPLINWESARERERMLGALRFIEDQIETRSSGKQVVDAFHLPSLEKGEASNNWVFTGLVETHEGTDKPLLQRYVAKLTSLCDIYSDPRCWSLDTLDLSDKLAADGRALIESAKDTVEPSRRNASDEFAAEEIEIFDRQSPATELHKEDDRNNQPEDSISSDNKIEDRVYENKTSVLPKNKQKSKSEGTEFNFPGDSESLVSSIQRRLNQLGYDSGPVDGKMGVQTSAAIEAYQRDHGVLPNGKPSEELLDHLARSMQSQSSSP